MTSSIKMKSPLNRSDFGGTDLTASGSHGQACPEFAEAWIQLSVQSNALASRGSVFLFCHSSPASPVPSLTRSPLSLNLSFFAF